MNFCKSCSFEAISARCFKRSSLSVMRKKYSSLCYSFRPPRLVEQASPLLPREYGGSAVFWGVCIRNTAANLFLRPMHNVTPHKRQLLAA